MDRTLLPALLLILGVAANAELFGPWNAAFEDTALASLDLNSANGLTSRTKVYRDLEENETGFCRVLKAQNGYWVRPKFYTKCENIGDSREQIREINAALLMGKDLGRSASALVLIQPQRTMVNHELSSFGASVSDQGHGGMGLLLRPFSRTTLMGLGKGIYWNKIDSARIDDRGWGSEWAGQSVFSPPFLADSISCIGELRNEEREYGQNLFSNVRIVGLKSFDSVTTAHFALRHAGGYNRDSSSRIDETNRSMSASAMIVSSPGKIRFRIFGERTHGEEPPARRIVVDGWQSAGSAAFFMERAKLEAAGGIGRGAEDNLSNFTLGHRDRLFWMKGEARLDPQEGLALEWRGQGKKVSSDYPKTTPEGDSLKDRLDRDDVSIEHWAGLTWVTAAACTLIFQGRYAEDISQYLLASKSGSNSIYEVFSLSPSVKWQLGSLLHHRQDFELIALYKRSPFAVSDNSLNRLLRTESVVTCFLGPRNRAIFTSDIWVSDQGQLDSLNFYEVINKQLRYDWILEWSRALWAGLQARPGFGMTYNRKTVFDGSMRAYVPQPAAATRNYSLRVQRTEGRFLLSARTMFIQDKADRGYWDASVYAQGGF